jgi:hypothetical protein
LKPRRALFLFHLRVGARLSLLVLAPVLAAVLFLYYILRPEFTLELARILFIEGSLIESGLIGTALLVGLARIVAPRLGAGSSGWARSLPAGRGARRLSAVFAVLIAEAPLLAVLGALVWFITAPDPALAAPYITRLVAHLGLAAPHIAGLIVGAAAAGLACLPALASPLMKLLLFVACFLSFSGHTAVLAASAALLVLSVVPPGRGAVPGKGRGLRSDLPSAVFFPGLSLRAVRGRLVLAYLPSAVVLGGAWLFLTNNELAARTAFSLSLFGLSLGLSGFIGTAAEILAERRPAWPWSRSLPRSAAARVRDDALLLALLALPLAAGLSILHRQAWEIVYLAGPLAWLAARGSGAMREAGDKPFGVLGKIAVEGTMISMALALLPWISFLLAAAAPVALLLARNSERRLKPTRWAPRHHANAGDPLSWSAQ